MATRRKFLAGGQSLMPTMNFRLAQPAILIDINPIDGPRRHPDGDGGGSRIGALTRYRALERDAACRRAFPLIAEALPHIAHPQIRNRGTIGGNLSHADPASELPAIVVALRRASSRPVGAAASAGSRRRFLRRRADHGPRSRRDADRDRTAGRAAAHRLLLHGDVARGAAISPSSASPPCDARRRTDDCSDARLAFCGVGETPVDRQSAASSR